MNQNIVCLLNITTFFHLVNTYPQTSVLNILLTHLTLWCNLHLTHLQQAENPMNIFYLDYDIELCAEYHNDKHCVKQVLEYFQLISTTLHLSGLPCPYKPTHINHTCAKWSRESGANLSYLESLFVYLSDEYEYRYGRVHACRIKWEEYYHTIQQCIDLLPSKDFTCPPLCMPDQYKTSCPVESYRLYYLGEKSRMLKWTCRDTPYWVGNLINKRDH